jgi:orotate phosphoribosyltransferase-like protein
LQNSALCNWDAFINLIGAQSILAAKICLLKSKGYSLQQIANRLHITKETARYWIEKRGLIPHENEPPQ